MIVTRIIAILLLTLYSALAAGVTIQHHTCGSTTEADLSPLPLEDPCGCDPWESSADRCCTVEIMTFQLADEQALSSPPAFPSVSSMPVLYASADVSMLTNEQSASHSFTDTSPARSVPTTILCCTFLI
jgi:hypothetical protein